MLESLLYISRSTMFMPDDVRIVREIVDVAQSRNQALDLTGALIFTHQHFAQYLEGRESDIADLMASIRRDPRHCEVQIVSARRIAARRFPTWRMAYSGPDAFIGSHVEALLGTGFPDASTLAVGRLIRLMTQLSPDALPRPQSRAA